MQGATSLPETGFLRDTDIVGRKATKRRPGKIGLLPISRSTWWAGVRSGRYPQPTRLLGNRITCWRVEDVLALIEAVAPKVAA